MNCKITRNAAKVLRRELDKPENADLKLKVFVTHSHGDHAHYGMDLAKPTDDEVLVSTDKEIDVLLTKGEEWLDGVKIDYLYFPQEGFVITNPSKGNHGDH
ncbi:iron-sulfur cluster assembly accessory protein [Paenibacillaceae bacterium WGS1546]|uniref:iron-sulfur cluster assembly accessory protein n=1 Tax=Cohnella sp. WGS1546 TaxID=3366810 RepID=UPI00372D75A0